MTPLENEFNQLHIFYGRLTIATMILPIIVAMVRANYLNKTLKIFFWFCVINLVCNLTEQLFIWSVNNYTEAWVPFLKKWDIHDTNFLQILYLITNFVFIGWFYGLLLDNKSKFGNYIKNGGFILAFFSIIIYLYIDGYNNAGSVNSTINTIFQFSLPALYLWFSYRSITILEFKKNPYFLISIGLLIPHLIGIFFEYVLDKIYETDFVLFVKFSFARNVFSVFAQLIFVYAFYYARYARFVEKQV